MSLVVLGVITATPVLALAWPSTLELGYGLGAQPDPMVDALLRHRGMLQAVLGAAIVWAAFRPSVRVPVALAAITTKSTFLVLIASLPAGSRSAATLGAVFDVVAVAVLAAVAVRHRRAARRAAGVSA